MTSRQPDRRSSTGRKAGYLAAIVVNAILWVVVNVRPGWREAPFLTEGFVDVVWLINLSLLAGVAVNAVYLFFDPAWFTSIGQIGVSVIGLVASLRALTVFPFDFSAYAFDWALVARVLLYIGVFGSIVSIIVELVRLTARGIRAAT